AHTAGRRPAGAERGPRAGPPVQRVRRPGRVGAQEPARDAAVVQSSDQSLLATGGAGQEPGATPNGRDVPPGTDRAPHGIADRSHLVVAYATTKSIDLTPFGFTPTESLVYGTLLGLGPATGYQVARAAPRFGSRHPGAAPRRRGRRHRRTRRGQCPSRNPDPARGGRPVRHHGDRRRRAHPGVVELPPAHR